MLSKLSRFLTIATLTTLTCVITHPANAEHHESDMMTPTYDRVNDVPQMVNDAFWRRDGDFFEDVRPQGYLDTVFGWSTFPLGSYPETELTRDALLIYTIMGDYFKQQNEDHPTLRTRDLINPFDTSLRNQPLPPVPDNPIIRREYQFSEPIPESEPVRGLY